MHLRNDRFICGLVVVLILLGCANPEGSSAEDTTTSSATGDEVPDYPATGAITTNIDADVPSWIRDNFKNIRAYRDGDYIVLKTRGLPPYKTYYYGATGQYSAFYDANTKPVHVNPNRIVEQAVTMRIPANPTLNESNLTEKQSEAGLGIIGISVNGVVIFNDQADPPDNIVNEVPTMDTLGGHPTQTGIYHYHIEPTVLIPASGAADELLGVAIDGFPIFGPKDKNGKILFDAGGNPNAATVGWDLGNRNWHGASTADTTIATGLPHYHVVYNFYQATTEDVGSIPAGTIEPDFYMIGNYIAGPKGTVTNEVSRRGGYGPGRRPR